MHLSLSTLVASYLEPSESKVSIRAKVLLFESFHEIMVLFVLRKLILQMSMRRNPVGLDVWFLGGLFVFFHTSCVRTVKAPARLRGCAGSPEPLLVAYKYHNLMSWLTWYTDLFCRSCVPNIEKKCFCPYPWILTCTRGMQDTCTALCRAILLVFNVQK